MASKTGIVTRFKVSDVAARLNATAERVTQACVNTMVYVGEKCVENARQYGNYHDITGNLRSSIGYAVLKHGRIIKISTDKAFGGPGGTVEGSAEARDFLNKLASRYPSGIVLIVVAGMEYAAYVEAIPGYNVLSSAELLAEQLVPQLLKKLGIK